MKKIFYIVIILFALIQTAIADESLVNKTNTKSLKEGFFLELNKNMITFRHNKSFDNIVRREGIMFFYKNFRDPAYQRYLYRLCNKLDNIDTLDLMLREECLLYKKFKGATDLIHELFYTLKARVEILDDDFVMNLLPLNMNKIASDNDIQNFRSADKCFLNRDLEETSEKQIDQKGMKE